MLAEAAAKLPAERVTDPQNPDGPKISPFAVLRNAALAKNFDKAAMDRFKVKQKAAFKGKDDKDNDFKEKTVLCNFRVQVSTSSQMVNYSGLRFGRDGKQVLGNDQDTSDEFVRVPNQSRMAARLEKAFGPI